MSNQQLIEDKISSLQSYLAILEHYQKHPQAALECDVTLKGAVERYLYLLVQATIDLADNYA